jgi:hypothetical protein
MAAKISIISVFAMIILALATLRFLSVQGGSSILAHSPLTLVVFTMVTLLLTGVVAGLTYLYYPNKEQERIIQVQNELEAKIQVRSWQIIGLTEKVRKLKDDLNGVSQMHKRIHTITLDMHKRIQAFFREAVGAFKLENTSKRNDGIMPSCFNQQVSSLQLDDEFFYQAPNVEKL